MQKRGQSDVIKYFITAVIIISIALLGFNIISKVGEKSCKAELARFQIDLKNLDKTVKFGSSQDFTYQVPCDADKIYFFDLSKDINLEFLDDIPLLKDSIKSKAEKNVFVIKDEKILDSFYAGNLNLGFPGYVCFVPKFEKINFIIEGSGKAASIFSGCFQPECTYIPINSTNEQAATVFNEAKNFGQSSYCPNCPQHVTSEFAFFVQTRENVDIFRKYEYCRETQKTNVEITIRPKGDAKLKQFRFYESIPKSCIDDLQKYLSSIDGEVSIKNDPLIVWSLADVKSEQKLYYVLDTLLLDECREKIAGLGVAELIEKGKRVAVPEIPIIEEEPVIGNTPPVIRELQNQNIEFRQQEQVVIANLWQYGSDKETISDELYYNIRSQSNEDLIYCNIERNKELWCTTKQNEESYSDIILEVSDGEFSKQQGIRISIARFVSAGECGDSICQENEDCSSCVEDCGLCPIDSEFKRLRCEAVKEVCHIPLFNNVDNECEGFEKTKIGECGLFDSLDKYRCSKSFLTDTCETNPVCTEGKAVEQIPCTPQAACQNECSNRGEKACVPGNYYRECGNFDSDNCYELGTPISCGSNKVCENGNCVTQAPVCANQCSVGQKRCIGDDDDNDKFQECATNANGCLVWGSANNCASGQICQNGACINAQAKLEASYSNLRYDSSQDRWYYDLKIKELNGVGVTLSHRQRCFQSIGCESQQNDVVAKFGTNKINPNGEITANNRWFWTSFRPDKMTETWYGNDNRGNSVDAVYNILIQ